MTHSISLSRGAALLTVLTLPMAAARSAWGAVDEYGLNFYHGNSLSAVLNNPNSLLDVRFSANKTVTVDRAVTYINLVHGSPNLQIDLRADDGFGNPVGANLASGSLAPAAGYDTLSLNTAVTLQSGSIYHLVQHVTNGASGTDAFVYFSSPGLNQSHTNDGTPESHYTRLYSTNNGGTWAASTTANLFWGLYGSSSGDAIGQPYVGGSAKAVSGSAWAGQSFTFSGWGSNQAVDAISMRIKKESASMGDDLRVHLVDVAAQTDLWSGTLVDKDAPISTDGSGNPIPLTDTYTISVPNLSLTPGKAYVLAVESAGSGSGYSLLANVATAPAGIVGENFQDAFGSQYVTGSSSLIFTGHDTPASKTDAFFTLHTVVPEPGSLSLLGLGMLMCVHRRRAR
jgi:hypothetical protein